MSDKKSTITQISETTVIPLAFVITIATMVFFVGSFANQQKVNTAKLETVVEQRELNELKEDIRALESSVDYLRNFCVLKPQ